MKTETKDKIIDMAIDIIVIGSLIALFVSLFRFVYDVFKWALGVYHG